MKLSFRDLINRLDNLSELAYPPMIGESSGAQTSYNRDSIYNESTGEYENWDENRDGEGFIRKEGNGFVVFEADGPGVIWRVWSANPQMGHIKIFLDGSKKPIIDTPFEHFFSRFQAGESTANLPDSDWYQYVNFPNLVYTLSRGRNRFLPIPYNRSCKIIFDRDWGRYFHFTYTTFPKDTDLPLFDGVYDREASKDLAQLDYRLYNRGRPKEESSISENDYITKIIAPGETVTFADIKGNRAITEISVYDIHSLTTESLRELAISIYWDGERSPSVWSPLGDFFGTAPGINYYRSLPVGMTEGKFYSRWFMPFSSQACINITNDGVESREVTLGVRHEALGQNADTLLRFHCKWHRDQLLEIPKNEGRTIDWPMLITKGSGRFCGVHLHIWNVWEEPEKDATRWWYGGRADDKSVTTWWGEGDEKFFVDGEKFPSTFGTGSEDYIGYAWAAIPPFPRFESPFASQPQIEVDAKGHTSVNRFHIADNIPFQKSFEASIERYMPERWGGGDDSNINFTVGNNVCMYDAVAYWYLDRGGKDPYGPLPLSERLGYFDNPDAYS